MGDFYLQMGKRISNLRKLHNMTQEQLAEVMDVSVKHISSIERGKSSLSLEKLVDLSDYFGCTLDYLIKGKSYNSNVSQDVQCSCQWVRSYNHHRRSEHYQRLPV